MPGILFAAGGRVNHLFRSRKRKVQYRRIIFFGTAQRDLNAGDLNPGDSAAALSQHRAHFKKMAVAQGIDK